MKNSSKEKTLLWINNQYKKGTIAFDHPLQRPLNQWSTEKKSLLIHSLLTGVPVNPIYVVDENNIIYPIDGAQRTSTCIDYLNDKFALSKSTPTVSIDNKENGEIVSKTYEIAGKKFSKLDEDVKNSLLAAALTFCTLSEYTDDDIRTMFIRQNAGKPLSSQLMRVALQSDKFSTTVYSLTNHPVMDKLMSKTQRKNGTDRNVIVQTFMLIATNQENDFTSFAKKDMDDFVINYADNYLDRADILDDGMDKLNDAFDELKIPQTSLPQILYSCYRVSKDKKSFSRLADKISEFLENYDSNEEYKKLLNAGTRSRESVRGRFDYWRNIIREIQ